MNFLLLVCPCVSIARFSPHYLRFLHSFPLASKSASFPLLFPEPVRLFAPITCQISCPVGFVRWPRMDFLGINLHLGASIISFRWWPQWLLLLLFFCLDRLIGVHTECANQSLSNALLISNMLPNECEYMRR